MKKVYIAPAVEEMALVTESMVAASVPVNNNETVDTSKPGTQLSDKQNNDWDNIWK